MEDEDVSFICEYTNLQVVDCCGFYLSHSRWSRYHLVALVRALSLPFAPFPHITERKVCGEFHQVKTPQHAVFLVVFRLGEIDNNLW